jgi:hypothetical protein
MVSNYTEGLFPTSEAFGVPVAREAVLWFGMFAIAKGVAGNSGASRTLS